uniref:Uncharacterized protein n=1 Tax=Solanum lycopersicum TaxID=4081 RepID=A0A3Q7IPV5_SOLLC
MVIFWAWESEAAVLSFAVLLQTFQSCLAQWDVLCEEAPNQRNEQAKQGLRELLLQPLAGLGIFSFLHQRVSIARCGSRNGAGGCNLILPSPTQLLRYWCLNQQRLTPSHDTAIKTNLKLNLRKQIREKESEQTTNNWWIQSLKDGYNVITEDSIHYFDSAGAN